LTPISNFLLFLGEGLAAGGGDPKQINIEKNALQQKKY